MSAPALNTANIHVPSSRIVTAKCPDCDVECTCLQLPPQLWATFTCGKCQFLFHRRIP